ncbi:F-BOX PROTEIN FAMILY-LIKE [Salix koriyanagi]|uniref:F-BOX PROTEIN FAMILY-LIKE n=1 Tax=Salix koriyanagi TaxID=2511006 RepID=A0A9Q0ZGL1_9ROSI|nr:F-BOX PROTEIN FAMILY-LIKE [Salix koriyanagi]
MVPEFGGSSLLLGLPDDVFAIISRSLSPRDMCTLSLCCRSLYGLVASEKVWLTQCDNVGIISHQDIMEWRKGVASYRAMCRFLVSVKPLIGIWVHQNPELGNVVYVIPGFVSVVGCRILPQELGPLGIEEGPILWAPVFEIIGDLDGSTSFFLHGREKGNDHVYPGSVKSVERNCNVLLLEVESRQQKSKLFPNKSFAYGSDKELARKLSRSHYGLSRSQRLIIQCEPKLPFSSLPFTDRRKLIDVVTSEVGQQVPRLENRLLFPRLRNDEESFQKDMALLFQRRSLLLKLCKLGQGFNWKEAPEVASDPTRLQWSEIRRILDWSSGSLNGDDYQMESNTKKSLGGYFRAYIRGIWGKSSSINGSHAHSKHSSSSRQSKHAQLLEFLGSGDTIGLSLHASKMKLSSYRAWPNMHDSQFALYKLPKRAPRADQEYAGLWGGTFGWPPRNPTEDSPGKALFFLLITYRESEGRRNLIATKILEGTHYVLHPNGSAMFIVNIDEPSQDPFPWDVDANSIPLTIEHAFAGKGIANGYGFRYPGSKPGSLYVIQNGLLAFVWKESRAVLNLQRLNLQELLKKGERVPALPPGANFTYSTRSYTNVFDCFSTASTFMPSRR